MLGIYSRRAEMLVATLKACGMKAKTPKGTFYVWAAVPEGKKSGEFAEEILEKASRRRRARHGLRRRTARDT